MTSTLPLGNQLPSRFHHSFLSFPISSSLSFSLLKEEERVCHLNTSNKYTRTMALQSPVRLQATNCMPTASVLLSPAGSNAGLYRPSDRFAPPRPCRQPPRVSAAPRISMRLASKQSYICRDCGYIYSDRTPFEKLSDKYFCPVCGAPKRRFREYTPAVSKNANAIDIRKARKAELQRDEAIGKALPIAIVIGAAALAGLYFYLNSTF